MVRSRLCAAAAAVFLITIAAPAGAQAPALDHARVITLVKQVWAAGTWDEQRAAFERLPEPERSAVWTALIDVRPGAVRLGSSDAPASFRGPCRDQEIDQCDYAPAPQPQPATKPGTNPSRPPVVTPPTTQCDSQTAYVPYYVAGEAEMTAFTYAARLSWCYLSPSATGPLSDYSSFSYAVNCCLFPWDTDQTKYLDKLTALPASNTLKIVDHHTGYFFAKAKAGPVEAGLTNTPNIDASVLPDGSYVCG
jgi:hypothetical protein